MRRTSRDTEAHILVAPFDLKLPAEFDIAPKHKVALPAGRTAMIFDVAVQKEDYNGKRSPKSVKGWRVVVVTKRGTFVKHNRYGNEPLAMEFTDALRLQLYLRQLAIEYSKTRKVTVDVEAHDEED